MNITKDYNYNLWGNNNCINFNIYVNKVQATEIENNSGTYIFKSHDILEESTKRTSRLQEIERMQEKW